MVSRYLDDFRFLCFTDEPVEGVECVPPPCEYGGWWGKVGFFRSDLPIDGPFLYLDLDVLVVGNLRSICWGEFKIIRQTKKIVSPKTVRRYNSSAMYFHKPGIRREVWDDFGPMLMDRYRGDQDWIGDRIPQEQTIPDSWIQMMERCKRGPGPSTRLVLCNTIRNHVAARHYPWVGEVWN